MNAGVKVIGLAEAESRYGLDWLLAQIRGAEIAEFGESHSRRLERLKGCIDRFRHGFFFAFAGDQLVGQLDIWPVSEATFTAISSGDRFEESLCAGDVVSGNFRKWPYWYMGSIVVAPSEQGRNALRAPDASTFRLLVSAVALFLSREISVYPFKMLAIVSTPAGARIANRWKLIAVNPTISGDPDYVNLPKEDATLATEGSRSNSRVAGRRIFSDDRPRYVRSFGSPQEVSDLVYWEKRSGG